VSFRILGTNHTSFTVSDVERTVGFMRDCLGFELISKAPRDPALVSRITGVAGADMMIAFMKAPGHTLELIQYLGPAARGAIQARPCDTGFAHSTSMTSWPPSRRSSHTGSSRSRSPSRSIRGRTRAARSSICATGTA
jgi:hypothetical protein